MRVENVRDTVSAVFGRAFVHVTVGLGISIAAFTLPHAWTLFLVGTATFVFLSIDLVRLRWAWAGDLFLRVFAPYLRDYEAQRLTGASYLLVAATVTIAAFPRDVAVLAISLLAVGDPLARVVRERFGRRRFFGKTVEGFLACLAGGAAAGIVWHYVGLDLQAGTIIMGVVVASLVQSLPLPVDDNLSMPVIAGATMWLAQMVL